MTKDAIESEIITSAIEYLQGMLKQVQHDGHTRPKSDIIKSEIVHSL